MRTLLIVSAAVTLLLTGCGNQAGDSGNQAGSSPSSASSAGPTGSGAGPAVPSGPCDLKVSADITKKPTVTFPKTCPPTQSLVSKDIVTGTGAPLKAGQNAVVQYVGISLSTRQQFDASWDRGQPFTVQNVGQAGVITGWNQGLPGMRKGGRRLLVIPPDLGYGPAGSGPIAPNETLIFVIDLVSITG